MTTTQEIQERHDELEKFYLSHCDCHISRDDLNVAASHNDRGVLLKRVVELESQLAEIESMKGYDGHFMDEDNRRIATIVYTHQQVQAILNREKQDG